MERLQEVFIHPRITASRIEHMLKTRKAVLVSTLVIVTIFGFSLERTKVGQKVLMAEEILVYPTLEREALTC